MRQDIAGGGDTDCLGLLNTESDHSTSTRIELCRLETDFHEDSVWMHDDDGRVCVKSTHTTGMFGPREWKALRESPWCVHYSCCNRLVLERVGNRTT